MKKVVLILLALVLLLVIIIGSGRLYNMHRIRQVFPIGSPLTGDVLRKMQQIVPYQREWLLVYAEQRPNYDKTIYYILCYDTTCHLRNIINFPSWYIDTVDNGRIEAVSRNEQSVVSEGLRRSYSYESSYFRGYALSLRHFDYILGDKNLKGIIQRVEVDRTTSDIHIWSTSIDSLPEEFRKDYEFESYASKPWRPWVFPADSQWTISLSDLQFNHGLYNEREIITQSYVYKMMTEKKVRTIISPIRSGFMFRDSLTRERFYDTLYARIQDRCRPIDR